MAKREVDEELSRRWASLLDERGLTEIECAERCWSARGSHAATAPGAVFEAYCSFGPRWSFPHWLYLGYFA